ncbi:DUF2252 domain-containing protein [Amantichitinum ursilacus]|uniref:DUF2252 domain-containing protein n=1 Tax=Amantichitinum ursilacus TaxID=857265 RepID=A0A0N0XLA1_9NEIS|nr:DUF2252 family protein [Amantichitinum ursilacus]KPC55352.1 hypothetical protein WG78_01805 [Amantichitinum ursilacus]
MNKIKTLSALLALTLAAASHAATTRDTWVVNDVYNYNHIYATTDSADLATKMSTMNSSAYSFYRGTADIFFHDMTTLPASAYANSATAHTWIGGDTHIGNFGAWQDSAGKAVFGVNDYDTGYLGQYVWDLRRAATSVVLAGRENGIKDADITTAINTLVTAYLTQLGAFNGSSTEKTFQLTTSNTSSVVKDVISAAAEDKRSDLLAKYSTVSSSKRTFLTSSTLVKPGTATYNAVVAAVATYVSTISSGKQYAASFYTVKDVRQKLGSGTGSLGRLRYYALLEGPSTSTSDDVIIELKQEATSDVAIANPAGLSTGDYANNEGDRVARTAKALVLNADVLIGYTSINGVPYYVHEKSPFAEDFDYTDLSSASKLNTAMTYIGQALASAHALADQDYDSSVVPYAIETEILNAVTSQAGLKTELVNFAFGYADQVNLDWASFKKAYAAGTPLY